MGIKLGETPTHDALNSQNKKLGYKLKGRERENSQKNLGIILGEKKVQKQEE